MKKSASVTLVITGCIALAGCEPATPAQQFKTYNTVQDSYVSQQDCAKEWGGDKCRASSGGGYVGPSYFWHNGMPYMGSASSNGFVPAPASISTRGSSVSGRSVTVGSVGVASHGGFGASAAHGSSAGG